MSTKKQTIFKINFERTLKNIKELVDQLPPQIRNGQVRRAIKGNVNSTAFHIYRLFMAGLKKTSRVVRAFRTTNTSLAKVSNNHVRTIQRHIQKLIDLGIIQAKVRVGNGLQLMLNEALLAFDAREVAFHPQSSVMSAPAPDFTATIAQKTEALRLKFSLKNALGG
ncbi:hypothetical protein AHMF7605_10360 [Adhaeribacter arboris]|uniref:Uncharacterized protein n=1 Tax=Adhaeribacter arboris TaxID=2072846 RepID=A0A2T2YEE9_9BACT|nr:hypothetical protein [Adhaeribacter arboris]PSR53890.1 hypothetical protein AHMF7605_10360 [Adhaeribacter arboris]